MEAIMQKRSHLMSLNETAYPSYQSAGSQDGGDLSSLLHKILCYLLQSSIAHDLLSRDPAIQRIIQSASDRTAFLEAFPSSVSNLSNDLTGLLGHLSRPQLGICSFEHTQSASCSE